MDLPCVVPLGPLKQMIPLSGQNQTSELHSREALCSSLLTILDALTWDAATLACGDSKNPNHRMLDLILAHKMKIRFTKISQSPRRHSVEHETLFNSYLLHVFFEIFQKFSTPHYLEFQIFLAITLKRTVNLFHKKISDVPSPLISCP